MFTPVLGIPVIGLAGIVALILVIIFMASRNKKKDTVEAVKEPAASSAPAPVRVAEPLAEEKALQAKPQKEEAAKPGPEPEPDVPALLEEADKLFSSHSQEGYKGAFSLYQKAAEAGDARAQYQLAQMYFLAYGTEQNLKEAVSCFQRAAGKGDPRALYVCGNLCKQGLGVKKDLMAACGFYERGAAQGSEDAKKALFALLEEKRAAAEAAFAAKDYQKAADEYAFCAVKGDAKAQHQMGYMSFLAYGMKQDMKEAVKWFSLAAENGNPQSLYVLGNLSRMGLGTEKDEAKAREYYEKAAQLGSEDARRALQI